METLATLHGAWNVWQKMVADWFINCFWGPFIQRKMDCLPLAIQYTPQEPKTLMYGNVCIKHHSADHYKATTTSERISSSSFSHLPTARCRHVSMSNMTTFRMECIFRYSTLSLWKAPSMDFCKSNLLWMKIFSQGQVSRFNLETTCLHACALIISL